MRNFILNNQNFKKSKVINIDNYYSKKINKNIFIYKVKFYSSKLESLKSNFKFILKFEKNSFYSYKQLQLFKTIELLVLNNINFSIIYIFLFFILSDYFH